MAVRVTPALERPASTWPVSGIAIIAPAAMHSSAKPIVVLEMSRRSWSHGMWATQVPIIAPFTAKTANVA